MVIQVSSIPHLLMKLDAIALARTVRRPRSAWQVELPVVGGLSVSEVGAICGVSVNCDWRVAPLEVAVMVMGVFVVTALVGMLTTADGLPAATVTVAGGLAAGELLERFTTI